MAHAGFPNGLSISMDIVIALIKQCVGIMAYI